MLQKTVRDYVEGAGPKAGWMSRDMAPESDDGTNGAGCRWGLYPGKYNGVGMGFLEQTGLEESLAIVLVLASLC